MPDHAGIYRPNNRPNRHTNRPKLGTLTGRASEPGRRLRARRRNEALYRPQPLVVLLQRFPENVFEDEEVEGELAS